MYTFSMTTVFAFFIFQAILFEITTGECPIECSQCKEMKDGPYMGRWNLKERNSTHCPTPNNGNVCLYRNVNNGTWMCFCDPGAFAYRESCGDITSTTPPTTPATSTTINAIDETTKTSTAITTPPSPTESTAISTVNTTTTTTTTTTTITTTATTTTTTTTTPTTTTSAEKFAITTTKNISITTSTATTTTTASTLTTTITTTTTTITTTPTTIPSTSTTTTLTIASSTLTPTTTTTSTTSTTSTTQTKNTILTSNSIYFIAGGAGAYRDIELYHPEKADLSCSKSPPPLNNNWAAHTTFYFNNTVHLCGGYYAGSTCISYSTNTEEWKTHTLSTRYGHSSTILNKEVYIIGGRDTSDNYVGAESTPLPLTDRPVLTPVLNLDYKGRYPCTTKVDEDKLVVTGGGNSNGYFSSVIEYNAKDHTTTALPSMKQPRFVHGCAVVEMDNTKWIIVAGGYNRADKYLKTTEMLQMGENAWKPLGNLNVARYSPSIAVTQRGVMAIGGFDGRSGSLSSVELLDWNGKSWRIVQPSLSKSRYFFGGAVEIPASMFDCRG